MLNRALKKKLKKRNEFLKKHKHKYKFVSVYAKPRIRINPYIYDPDKPIFGAKGEVGKLRRTTNMTLEQAKKLSGIEKMLRSYQLELLKVTDPDIFRHMLRSISHWEEEKLHLLRKIYGNY